MFREDTIVAISTPPGEGAIGIVRMSGELSVEIANKIFVQKNRASITTEDHRRMLYGHVYRESSVVDEVLLVPMFAPGTYTREDMVEVHCHGGIVPMTEIVKLILENGASMAEPGEFTKRAFLNGRLDLAQAESIMDLIQAKTPQGFNVAYNQLEGHLSRKVDAVRAALLAAMAQLEVCIDYPEEDIEEMTYAEMTSRFTAAEKSISELLKKSETGRILRDGLSTVIVGKPNVGKSSLLNALLRESRAIVTDIPGTTRDIIEETLNIRGVPIKLVDTAGIRETDDLVEKLGVERSKAFFNSADLVVFVLNAAEALSEEDEKIMGYLRGRRAIVLLNKSDLAPVIDEVNLRESLGEHVPIVKTSLIQEEGIQELEDEIAKMVYGGEVSLSERSLVTNLRHQDALRRAAKSLSEAVESCRVNMPYDFLQVDVKNAYEALGEITGETVENDLITKIFSQFCLGK
ncbi:tRNA uridine-5-carboxymethylaminomethyl(34) synthesis GTPase MnmE [Acidaminobacter hydrogenoformans]|uniref:tRNA modification GTPase MnmE n=1 Tax=Acidaminobacter hydrogenoformans DSM 2784 TaxID=1120920 RepID=A0A1G5RT86_9FIRM|nr:tRNA uridine-5-carboxymethylaminomethyl(34) synthesis GTPase MnmE [Acidaminobacter hydrogenoformans]SCZ76661.1 tRNA modification GTPase trmE [Acidaminobacter hydrogenoformans DSM 2784]